MSESEKKAMATGSFAPKRLTKETVANTMRAVAKMNPGAGVILVVVQPSAGGGRQTGASSCSAPGAGGPP